MKVLITQGYNDRVLGRTVRKGEELSVSEQRAQQLVKSKVAEILSEDMSDLNARISELESDNTALKDALTKRDARISELESALKAKK